MSLVKVDIILVNLFFGISKGGDVSIICDDFIYDILNK